MTDDRQWRYDAATNEHRNPVTTTTTTTTTSASTGTSTGGTTTGTGARARSIEANVLHGWYLDCCEYYADSFRRAPATVIRRNIAETIRDGMTGECLCAIMDEAQTAPRPSWAYCMAIVRRCQAEGIKTLKDWQADRQRRQSARNPALQYQQREYTDEDFGPDFFVDLTQY